MQHDSHAFGPTETVVDSIRPECKIVSQYSIMENRRPLKATILID